MIKVNISLSVLICETNQTCSKSEDAKFFFDGRKESNEEQPELRTTENVRFKGNFDLYDDHDDDHGDDEVHDDNDDNEKYPFQIFNVETFLP